jgi:hypothetical protein
MFEKEPFTEEICRGIPKNKITPTGRVSSKENPEYKACKIKAEATLDKAISKGIEAGIKKCITNKISSDSGTFTPKDTSKLFQTSETREPGFFEGVKPVKLEEKI